MREGKKLGLLVAELQHRMRNLLGLVDMLAERTATENAQIEDFIVAFRARLMALGRVQAFLTPAPGQPPPALNELLVTELQAVSGLDLSLSQSCVSLRGAAGIMLDKNAAQIVVLAIHELATNSAKYGVLGSFPGKLAVRWSKVRQLGQNWLRIEWRETALSRTQSSMSETGFGRELIERGLPQQFHARTRYVVGEDSIRCVIDLPEP
jgi:two-component system CheB/CheR fusion protein